MAGKYGGAAFILVYLLFLVILGLPIIVCEFSVGTEESIPVYFSETSEAVTEANSPFAMRKQ